MGCVTWDESHEMNMLLRPLIFLIYINDINSSSIVVVFVTFADDTNILIADKNISYEKVNKVVKE